MTLDLQQAARDHLWLHFTRMGGYRDAEVPIIVPSAVAARLEMAAILSEAPIASLRPGTESQWSQLSSVNPCQV